jgi:hypothetical protein
MSHVRTADDLGLRRRVTPVPRRAPARSISAGIVAGAVGGITMAIALALFHYSIGKSPFLPFTLIGASVLNDPHAAASGSLLVAAVGFAVHITVPSLGWGVIYGVLDVLLRPQRASSLLFMGLAVGAFAQVVDVMILLPWLNAAHVIRDAWRPEIHPMVSWVAHLVYGVGLCFYPWKYDPLSGRFV